MYNKLCKRFGQSNLKKYNGIIYIIYGVLYIKDMQASKKIFIRILSIVFAKSYLHSAFVLLYTINREATSYEPYFKYSTIVLIIVNIA